MSNAMKGASPPLLEVIARWLSSQPFTSVLLALVLACGAYVAWYTVETAIPNHIRLIQDGYDRQAERDAANLTRVIDSYEKTLDRMQPRKD